MKIILLSIAFCALINTAVAQNAKIDAASPEKKEELTDTKNTIADNVAAAKQASLFSRSLNICGLLQTFNSPGPLTVFLPLDSAFTNLSKGTMDSLLRPQNKYALTEMITYHALPGNVSAKNIAKEIGRNKGLAVFKTISGAPLKAQFGSGYNIILIDEKGGKSIIQKTDLKQQKWPHTFNLCSALS